MGSVRRLPACQIDWGTTIRLENAETRPFFKKSYLPVQSIGIRQWQPLAVAAVTV